MDIKKKIEELKKWAKSHETELIVYGTTALLGGAVVGCALKYSDSIPVTVDDVTEVTEIPTLPESGLKLENVITMYDDRLNCWVPVVRKLTDDEFEEIKEAMTENPDATLTGCLMVRDLLPDYLYG